MIKGKHHIVFDEITYNRIELSDFVSNFENCIVSYNDYAERVLRNKEFEYLDGYNILDTSLIEGKHAIDYPIIRDLVNKFNINVDYKRVNLMHFDTGYSFPIHTDHAMKAGIMFPIWPEDAGEPIVFYKTDNVKVATDYNHLTEEDIDYKHYYSNKHPTLFNAQIPHGVPTVKEPRLYLKIRLFDDTYESIDDNFIKKEKELGGPKGLEPTRFKTWESKGREIDF